MAFDTPARIAVLGAGPIGLEAALYGRFLGYNVEILERGGVGENVLRWGHVRMFSPFGMNCSPLGRAALAAQDEAYRSPAEEALLTGRQWVEQYLLPLSQTDLLADHLHLDTTVVSLSRPGELKSDRPGDPERGETPFRILCRDGSGREWVTSADIVIDTTGVSHNPNWLGPGGSPAGGESTRRAEIEYGLPDVLGSQRSRYAGQRTLVVGSGYSAATTVVALADLATEVPGTSIVWVTRQPLGQDHGGPVTPLADDPLEARRRLTDAANRLAAATDGPVAHRPGTWVEALAAGAAGEPFEVTLRGEHAGNLTVDRIVAQVGYRPDTAIFRELQVQLCYATEGPLKLAAALLSAAGGDCLSLPAGGADQLRHPEPNFYVLGAKSYGRNSQFLFARGLDQIRHLFRLIGDRAGLDLYQGARSLPQ